MRDYEERNIVLREMGFATYAEYLTSPLWQAIRTKALANRKTCSVCGEPATEVHHRSYSRDVMTGKDVGSLMPLCATCHDLGEFSTDGVKHTLLQANDRLDSLTQLSPESQPKPTKIRRGKSSRIRFDINAIRKQLKLDGESTVKEVKKGLPHPKCKRCDKRSNVVIPSDVCNECVKKIWLFRKRPHGF